MLLHLIISTTGSNWMASENAPCCVPGMLLSFFCFVRARIHSLTVCVVDWEVAAALEGWCQCSHSFLQHSMKPNCAKWCCPILFHRCVSVRACILTLEITWYNVCPYATAEHIAVSGSYIHVYYPNDSKTILVVWIMLYVVNIPDKYFEFMM